MSEISQSDSEIHSGDTVRFKDFLCERETWETIDCNTIDTGK